MTKEETFQLGVIIKTFSFKGEVVARFDVPDPLVYSDVERVYLLHGESLVPYFIEKMSHKSGNLFRFGFEDVTTEQQGKALVGCGIFLPLDELDHEDAPGPELVGYQVEDKVQGQLGEVIEYLDLPNNPQLEVRSGDREFLIPLQAAFILAIDREKKLIQTDLPEGLVDL